MGDLFDQVKADLARKDACRLHQFPGGPVKKIYSWHRCLNCGGEFRLTEIGTYIRGYRAAGADVNRVWPGWDGEN